MKYSHLFGKTLKEAPKDAALISHKLLYQGGFMRESTAGRYFLLPLGMRVHRKIEKIIKEEMDKTGAQETIIPILHPKYLWKETNRTAEVGFELMEITDRNEMEFVLGGTAEEMLVDLVRKFQLSYKELPFNLYQFSVKFRDEMRARGGLLRLREFIMKDAYSFHAGEQDFKREYDAMRQAYAAIFNRIGLKTVVVEADNGYIGGEYCHEFVVESESGESKFFQTEDGAYAAHEEVVRFARNINCDEAEVPMEIVKGVGVIGVEKVAAHLGIPVAKTTKTLFYEDEKSNLIGAVVSGEYAVNETKLKHAAGAVMLSLAKEEAIKKRTGATVGYAGLVNLPGTIRVFVDISLKGRKNFETGANRTGYHAKNVNFGRDVSHPDRFYDIAVPNDSSRGPNGQELIQKRGIEVGNIFQLGYHYSKLMKDAVFTDAQGLKKPLYMGCYGIGLERTLATVVEVHHDGKGIIWPESIAPFQVHLISLTNDARADQVYESLNAAGIEVLFDDRDISAGEKFADCDLIGIPIRLVISKKTGEKVEWKRRNETESTHIGLGDVITRLKT